MLSSTATKIILCFWWYGRIQPGTATVLADTAIRGEELDAKKKAEKLSIGCGEYQNQHGDIDFAQAAGELAKAIARIRVIELTKQRR